MNIKNLVSLIIISFSVAIYSNNSQQEDSVSIYKYQSINQKTFNKNGTYNNPGIALTASLLLPGAGQFYQKKYFMGGLYLISEIGLGIFCYQQSIYNSYLKNKADSINHIALLYKDSIIVIKSITDTTKLDTTYFGYYWKLKADSAMLETKDPKNIIKQTISWMAGIYYYNIMDALYNTGIFYNTLPKNPVLAGWLSAIPALGLGQLYNGEISKAGMIFMVQFNLAYIAINNHLLMTDCEKILTTIELNKSKYFNSNQKDRIDFIRKTAFRNRNMFLWYSLAFYFYGIFDAIVDAHLHDAPVKMRLEPDLIPENKKFGLKAEINF
jgi:TM2 domain-containing membrane protein YozV